VHSQTLYKKYTFCKHRFPGNTLTHSTNEDLLNIKRKGDPEVSYPLSYVWYHWNSEPVFNKNHLFFNLFNLFWHTDKNFCFYAEVNFWDFVRNDNSNKGTTARLKETRFGPKNKSSPIYLDTFVSIPYISLVFTSHENRWRHFTESKSCQIMESILKYKNGFKNNLMYKEIFNYPFFENSNRHMNEGLTLLIAISENR
jgi:hypothetical protein